MPDPGIGDGPDSSGLNLKQKLLVVAIFMGGISVIILLVGILTR